MIQSAELGPVRQMPTREVTPSAPSVAALEPGGPGARLAAAVARLAGRLATALQEVFPELDASRESGNLEAGIAFLSARSRAFDGEAGDAGTPVAETDPLGRLAGGLGLADVEVDLLLLAGMAEEHEGYADVLARLHPDGRPAATPALAALLFCPREEERRVLRRILVAGPASTSGALRAEGDGPLFGRSLRLAEALWPALAGLDAWPASLGRRRILHQDGALEGWLQDPAPRRAVATLESTEPCTVVVGAAESETAFQRAAALALAAGVRTVAMDVEGALTPEQERSLALQCLVRNAVPVLRLEAAEGPAKLVVPEMEDFPGPVVVGATAGAEARGRRPVVGIECRRLTSTELAEVWRRALPSLEARAEELALRFPVEPYLARRVAADLLQRVAAEGRPPVPGDVAASLRSRAGAALRSGVQRRRPTAGWGQLVLPREKLDLLRSAVSRLELQAQVLDRWRFLEGRPGARGVRMMLAGPPGTGKTLSAEVLASALGVDLLVVDLARVVSKWIGETEKNLAEVFEAAEQARAVLLFDEADALFGRRTEVSDAHDRYANLETAFLLARLESFEGLAVLTTNLRQNIDHAFLRRLEIVVDYAEPGRRERRALWRCHLPSEAPLAADVDLDELAAHFPMSGALIRNAAVAAAFQAASEAASEAVQIRRDHFLAAIRRELEKSGKSFPGFPAVPQAVGTPGRSKGGPTP